MFRFFASCKDFLANYRRACGLQPQQLPGPNDSLLSELGDFTRNGFYSHRLEPRQNRRKARAPRHQAAKKSDQVLLTLCEKRIFGCGSAALCSSAANPFSASYWKRHGARTRALLA
jgi:hypothetical protein